MSIDVAGLRKIIDDAVETHTDIDLALRRKYLSPHAVMLNLLVLAERAERLEGELREARAALEFYANERHYDEAGVVGKAHFSSSPMEPTEYEFEADYGHRARLALGLTTIDPAAVSGEGDEG